MTARIPSTLALAATDHAAARAATEAKGLTMRQKEVVCVKVSGRRDKDIYTVAKAAGAEI